MGHRLRLMNIGSSYPPLGERGPEPVVDRGRVVGEVRRLGGKPTPGGDDRPLERPGDGNTLRSISTGCSGWDEALKHLEQGGVALPV